MRSFLFQRFGAGQPEVLEKRVKHYLEGMPDEKTGMVFPPRCNMEDKLNELEKEREFLLDMCLLIKGTITMMGKKQHLPE